MTEELNLRVVVVDDSAYNRQTITAMLESLPGIEVVGRAMNGKEALKLAFDLEPDVITLDLEMPEMDGFAFLRLLMNKRPTPVIVVSGYAQRENVFRALELGALDFVAKPGRHISPDLRNIEDELLLKIGVVRKLQAVRLRERAQKLAAAGVPVNLPHAHTGKIMREAAALGEPAAIIGIASSTGGPPAVQHVLSGLAGDLPAAIFIAQHMPARFTRAFAERLDRMVSLRVVEASDGQPVRTGVVYVSPGSKNMEVERGAAGTVVRVVDPPRGRGNVLTPSGDHLFKSLAPVYGERLCTLVLTGMGNDGSEGVRAAKAAGGRVICEDPETAVMPGMPFSAVETGAADEVVALEDLAPALTAFVQGRVAGTA